MARCDLPLAVGPSSANALPATRDVYDRAADIRGLVAGEPEDGARYFLGLARAPERRAGADALGATGIAAGGMDFGAHDARANGVDAHAFAADFLRKPERERVDRRLGRGIVDVHARRADARRDR